MQKLQAPPVAALKYPPATSPFRAELNQRVKAYFAERALGEGGGPRMWLKTLVMFAWAVGSYVLLVAWAGVWWQALLSSVSLGFALAGIGFSVMHDGGHNAYSKSKVLNRLGAWSLDLLGGSSYFWNYKHNVFHHFYPNIVGADDDLNAGIWIRMAPGQPRLWFHRLQHWYSWALYGVLPVKWFFIDDFVTLAKGQMGALAVPRPKGKALWFGWALALPLALGHPVLYVLAGFAITSGVLGVTLATVFQMAHCVEGAEFATVPEPGRRIEREWAEHQLATTFDFCPGNPLITWYVGGLNYQVEHHLFPRICHLHYPAISEIVKQVCAEHGVTHNTNPTLWSALRSHGRHLELMGR